MDQDNHDKHLATRIPRPFFYVTTLLRPGNVGQKYSPRRPNRIAMVSNTKPIVVTFEFYSPNSNTGHGDNLMRNATSTTIKAFLRQEQPYFLPTRQHSPSSVLIQRESHPVTMQEQAEALIHTKVPVTNCPEDWTYDKTARRVSFSRHRNARSRSTSYVVDGQTIIDLMTSIGFPSELLRNLFNLLY